VDPTFAPGDKVLLIDGKSRRYLVTLREGGQFHTHAGVTPHDLILGLPDGSTVRSPSGARYLALRPTLADFVLSMPRGAQVIYPKDLRPAWGRVPCR
jgi:tRNA (adenine57-N1/adenine58-N1)-methyltransferase